MEKLRRRNRKLEEEIKILQEQVMQSYGKNPNLELNNRLYNEIEFLKGKPDILRRPGTSDLNLENLRKERNELQEENRRLIGMVIIKKKFFIY